MPRTRTSEIGLVKLMDARVERGTAKSNATLLRKVAALENTVKALRRDVVATNNNALTAADGIIHQLNAILERAGMQDHMVQLFDTPND